ncbi:hypothetical protein GGS26DRAFT_557703 [Hypomontagnella submonticulosa]|nr:hypothetical protein GGS26DRAFT_557703 [Hypomontagnella submonticulosa]
MSSRIMDYRTPTTLSTIIPGQAADLSPRDPADQPTTLPPIVINPTGDGTFPPLPSFEPLPSSSQAMNVGIAIAAAVGVLVLVMGIYCFRRLVKKRKGASQEAERGRQNPTPAEGLSEGNPKGGTHYHNATINNYYGSRTREDRNREDSRGTGTTAAESIELSEIGTAVSGSLSSAATPTAPAQARVARAGLAAAPTAPPPAPSPAPPPAPPTLQGGMIST